jgi:predicted AAA+ superfamily ATPase
MEINDYDYQKMIKDFEMNARFENNKKKLRKKWKIFHEKYQTTIEHMKEYREQSYRQKKSALIKKLNKKENTLITSLENIRNDKMREKERIIAQMMEKEKIARENVEKFMEEQEQLRLDFQKETDERRKKIFFL